MNPESYVIRAAGGRQANLVILTIAAGLALSGVRAAEGGAAPWRSLPLIADGKVAPEWVHVGWGKFTVDNATVRTDCVPQGLGLLVYRRERLGNCQIRVVFKAKDGKSNSGVYVRIADGILDQVGKTGAAFDRDAAGKISDESMER